MKNYLLIFIMLLTASVAFPQDQGFQAPQQAVNMNKYIPDTQSVESVISTLLECVSGPANQDRDWLRFANLFTANADMAMVQKTKDGKLIAQSVPFGEFIAKNGPLYKARGFRQTELNRTISQWNGVATVIQSYEFSVANSDYTLRGVNNIQLLKSEGRWFISNLVFSNEDDQTKIPPNFLNSN